MKDNVDILADTSYIIVTKTIENNVQYHIEEEHKITLSSEGVNTSNDSFLLEEVLDISYRFFSKEMGFLYLHTTKGMYSYNVRVNPLPFIEKFKKLK